MSEGPHNSADSVLSIIIPVYRNAESAIELAAALAAQELPASCRAEIILVDDGSNDGTAATLQPHESSTLQVVTLQENRGRAVARNAGATQAQGNVLVFIDCDCRPVGKDFLLSHWQNLRSGGIASCGPLAALEDRFWSRYQRDASSRRAQRHTEGTTFAGTTANLAVIRDAFVNVGGFDTRYCSYGFEDRDLLLRLSGVGQVGWCPDAIVLHVDKLSLPTVLEKMQRAAGESAALFSHDHPHAYHALGYAAIDTRLHGWLRPVCAIFRPLLRCAATLETLLHQRWMPYPFSKTIAKLMTALAFAVGTARAPRQEGRGKS